MGVKDKYYVNKIDSFYCREWLLYKHYAKRVPAIEHSFGLYCDKKLIGVCCFGPPPRVMNDGESIFNEYKIKTFELNRLCVNDDICKNGLSFFVSTCLKMLPTPSCVVSYADDDFGHKGYIYQATNWIYCGRNNVHQRKIIYNGEEVHPRTACSKGYTNITEWAKNDKNVELGDYMYKHRYFYFLGTKRDIKNMRAKFLYDIFPYPKGDNKRYDSSYTPTIQSSLF